MTQASQSTTPSPPKGPKLIWLVGIGLILLGGFAGSLGSRIGRHGDSERSSNQLKNGIHDFQIGNEKASLSIIKPLADRGNAKAQYWLADIYFDDGVGQKQNLANALSYLQKSASQGFVPAEGRLGEVYMDGDKTLQDFTQAKIWLRKASIAGDVRAQRLTGRVFELGLGVEKSPAQAYGWFENAASSGNPLAQRMRDQLLAHMSAAEKSQGEQNAKAISAEIESSRATRSPSSKPDSKS